jgi:hypothetical protein
VAPVRIPVTVKLSIAVGLALVAACGSSPPPASPEPTPTPDAAIAPPPPIDAAPPPVGYRGRVDVPAAAGGTAASWIDVEVLGDGDGQRAACEAALTEQASVQDAARAGARIVRPCDLAALPAAPLSGVLLVDGVTRDQRGVAVRVAEHIAMPSQAECEVARQRLEADHERSDADAQVRAGGILAAERDRLRDLAEKACATEADMTKRCSRATSKRTRERCATEQPSAAQECQRNRDLLAVAEQQATAPVPRPVRAVACLLP